jgi:hypothetical protein
MFFGRSSLLALVVGLVATGCSPLAASRPDAQGFEAVGILSGLSEANTTTTYTFADGRTWDRPKDQFRVVYDMPAGETLFVAGQDKTGPYVLLIGGQQGSPPDCPYSLRYGAREWGDAIESQGYLWHKSDDFATLTLSPGVGAEYPGSVIVCLDAGANVTAVLRVTPPEGSEPAPAGSATAP